ncbi:MAG: tetratricopeptide repeat protein [Mariniphaga sp.]
MQLIATRLWIPSFIILIVMLFSLPAAYTQESQTAKELDEAINHAKSGKFEQAIPILKKYAEMKGLDDFKTLSANVYLNWCYLETKNEALDVGKVNALTDAFIKEYGISKFNSIKRDELIKLLWFAGTINSNIGNNGKLIFYLSSIYKQYHDNNLKWDRSYSEALIAKAQKFYNLKDFATAIDIGEIALKANSEFFGEKNETSLIILNLLALSYQKNNEPRKSIESLRQRVLIGKQLLGEKHPDYLNSLSNLASVYSDLGDYNRSLEINLKVTELRKTVLGERNQDYLTNQNNLASNYSNLGQFQKAFEIDQNVVDIRKVVLGKRHPDYLTSLSYLASDYTDLGDYQKALEIDKQVVEVQKEVLGERHPDYLTSLSNLAYDYSDLGDYQKALDIIKKVAEIQKEVLGDRHPDYIKSLHFIANFYAGLGDYQEALGINQKVAEFRKKVLGDRHPDYIKSLNLIAEDYTGLGNYQKAYEIDKQVVEIRKEVLGERHPDYLFSLCNLASDYTDLGDYQKALEIIKQVVEIQKEVLGERHPDYLSSLSDLAYGYSDLGDYQKALEINQKVAEIQKEVLGDRHPDYIKSLHFIANFYAGLGNYQEALEINQKVAEFRKEVLGDRHPDYIRSLNLIAEDYTGLGNYQKAYEIDKQVVGIRKEVLGERHSDYLFSLSNLASDYTDLGDYQKALDIDKQVVEIQKEVLGERHPDYLTSLNNLAYDYSDLGDYQKALEINQIVAEIQKEVLGERHPDYIKSLHFIANFYASLGDYREALGINQKVAEFRKEVLGDRHPDYIKSLNLIAEDYTGLGDYQKALEINQKVFEIRKEVLGENHPDYVLCLGNLAYLEFYLSKTKSALTHYLQMLKETQKRVIAYLSLMTEHQRELFWKQYSHSFMLFPMFFEKLAVSNPEGAGDAYDISLFSKGLLLNTSQDFDQLIAEKGTPEAIAEFEVLKLLKLQIQRILEKPLAERYLNVDSLENLAQQKETELVKLSKEYGDYTQNLKVTWKDVQANLGDKDVAIEFVEYPTLTDTVKYAALVLRKGWQYPKMISLFRKDQIQEFLKLDKDVIYSNGFVGKQLKKLIWKPIEAVVSTIDRIYFSPAGILHQLAIENLPANDSLTLGDLFEIHRLSSTKELAKKVPEIKNTSAVLYGGLQYDLPANKMAAESKKYEKKENLYAMRGYQNNTSVRSDLKFLAGTKPEVDEINKLMNEHQYRITKYTGETGNEESFKSLSGKKEAIIHIATHGFFESVEESRKNPFMQMRMGDQKEGLGVDPMLRSGLMLSGANRAWLGGKVAENIEDGVLTALEISRMELRGTDLVVLSACETGLGEVSSEGVFGLQRSFKQAGVQTLLMSLWKVNDESTRYLMTEFYSGLLSGKEKRAAFLEAKQKCKAEFHFPRYWAAFIMLD